MIKQLDVVSLLGAKAFLNACTLAQFGKIVGVTFDIAGIGTEFYELGKAK